MTLRVSDQELPWRVCAKHRAMQGTRDLWVARALPASQGITSLQQSRALDPRARYFCLVLFTDLHDRGVSCTDMSSAFETEHSVLMASMNVLLVLRTLTKRMRRRPVVPLVPPTPSRLKLLVITMIC